MAIKYILFGIGSLVLGIFCAIFAHTSDPQKAGTIVFAITITLAVISLVIDIILEDGILIFIAMLVFGLLSTGAGLFYGISSDFTGMTLALSCGAGLNFGLFVVNVTVTTKLIKDG